MNHNVIFFFYRKAHPAAPAGSPHHKGLKGVSSEWPLDKAQNFLGQWLASVGVRGGAEDDKAGYFLHFFDGFPEFPLIGNGFLQSGKLGLAQGHRHRFPGHFAERGQLRVLSYLSYSQPRSIRWCPICPDASQNVKIQIAAISLYDITIN